MKIKSFFKQPKNQGRIIIVLAVFGLVFGLWRIQYTIRNPFLLKNDLIATTAQTELADQVKTVAQLRSQDTDGDGLSDYDELYVYNTSPYLEDTDSDGYADKLEVETENNPNCPAGEKCLLDTTTAATSSIAAGSQFDPIALSTDELRQMLLDAGADQESLQQIDDTTLRQMFMEAYDQTSQSAQVSTPAQAITSSGTGTTATPSPTDLRQLLLQAGVPAAQVESVSDEELLQLYQEILSEQTTNQ